MCSHRNAQTQRLPCWARDSALFKHFRTTIIDVAVQAIKADRLIAAVKANNRLILVGDEKQLNAVASTPELELSLYEQLLKSHQAMTLQILETLRANFQVQYRMHSGIAHFSNAVTTRRD